MEGIVEVVNNAILKVHRADVTKHTIPIVIRTILVASHGK